MNKNDNKKNIKKTRDHEYNIKEFKVKKECELLTFLLEVMPEKSRNNVKKILANNQVAVDGAPVTQFNFVLVKDDVVIISKYRIQKKTRKDLPIIFENNELIVINKPAGLLSIASDKEKGRTAYRLVTDWVQQKDRHNRVFVVHRLDEDTSGVLMFAKNASIRDLLQKEWNNIVKVRGYYAIVENKMENEEGFYIDYLKQNAVNLMTITRKSKDAKKCITKYKTIKSNDKFSFLDVNIETGRKNQIRVQLGARDHHIIGDDKYGEPCNPIKRLGLHAYELTLIHPLSKKLITFKAPLPNEMEKFINKI